ncbi:hypothetical protein LINPERHAP2_LOCUS39528, partial [Linum perenne]
RGSRLVLATRRQVGSRGRRKREVWVKKGLFGVAIDLFWGGSNTQRIRFKPPWFDPDINEVCETEILGSGVGYVRGRVSTP